jgi:hypothetical protein
MFSIHQAIFHFVHPALGIRTNYPTIRKLLPQNFLKLKNDNWWSFVPSAKQTKITVKFERSCPVDNIDTVLVPDCSIVVLLGKSNAIGVSSILP